MTIFQLPDGREFDVPDSVPPEQALAGLRAKFGQPQQPPPQQPAIQQPPPQEASQPLSLSDRIAKSLIEQKQPGAAEIADRQRQEIGEAFTSRETARAAGGVLGGALGIPAGPAGVVAGGALGAAGGDALFNILESAGNVFGGQEVKPVTAEGVIKAFESPIKAGTEDITATLGLGAAGAAVRGVKPLVGKAIGAAKGEAKELARLATQLGVPLGAINVTASNVIKGFAKVAGVFPFVGTPVRQAQQTAQSSLDNALDRTLNAVAPVATLQDVGIDLTKAAQSRFKAFRRLSGSLYDNFLKKAENATVPDIFPTNNLKAAANDINALQETGEIALEGGGKFGSVGSDAISSFINDATKLPERLTATQVRGLQRSLQELMSKAAADGWDVSRGVQLKKALELDFNNPAVDLLNFQEGKELVESLTTANKFFADNIKDFQTATTKKFGRIDKNIFKPKFFAAGTKESDEAFSAVFNAKSPQGLENLRKIVGPKPFKQAVRKQLDNSISKAIIEPASEGAPRIFDPVKLEAQLGLVTPDGRNTLRAMLKGTPLKIEDLDAFNRVSKAVGSVEIPDVSTFIKRRAVLGGAGAAAGAFGAASVFGSPVAGVALVVAARKGLRLLSDPAQLKSLTTALDSTATQKAQRAAVLRLIRNIPDPEERQALRDELGN